MSQSELFPVPSEWAERALMTAADYDAAVREVEVDPDGYWRKLAGRLDWIKPPTRIKDVSFHQADFHIRWFWDGVLNVSAECVDRHLPKRANDAAYIWEGDDPSESRTVTYGELYADVCRMANVLKAHGVKKGDRVTIYMPMIVETPVGAV